MARKYIVVDDLTGNEIEGNSVAIRITVQEISLDALGVATVIPGTEVASEWELTDYTAGAVQDFVGTGDLPDFIVRMRPMVKLASAETEIIRKWAKEKHPEMKVEARGRIPAEVQALYRREVVQRTEAGDGAK
jgi:hypothetical protein